MKCSEVSPLLDAYIDKQLDAANTIAIENHLSHCPSCQQRQEELVAMQQAIRKGLPYHRAPRNLASNILATCTQQVTQQRNKTPAGVRWLHYGTSLAAGVFIAYLVVTTYLHEHNERILIESILSSHIKALSTDRLTDIRGSSSRDITPWLTSKLDYAPKVYNLSPQGFELLGARLDSLPKQRIAALTYQYNHHLVDIYTWPSADVDDAPTESHTTQGYHLIYWCKDRMNYWIVSDLNLSQLQLLAADIQQQQASISH